MAMTGITARFSNHFHGNHKEVASSHIVKAKIVIATHNAGPYAWALLNLLFNATTDIILCSCMHISYKALIVSVCGLKTQIKV